MKINGNLWEFMGIHENPQNPHILHFGATRAAAHGRRGGISPAPVDKMAAGAGGAARSDFWKHVKL